MTRPLHNSEHVARIGERLFGAEWAGPLARFAGVNDRTVRRVREAAECGVEYPAARGVISALHDALAALVAELMVLGAD